MNIDQTQRALLKYIATEKLRGVETSVGMFVPPHSQVITQVAKKQFGLETEAIWADWQHAAWGLLSAGYVVFDGLEISRPNEWRVRLTPKGELVAKDEPISPHDPTRYMQRLLVKAPNTTSIVKGYLEEALNCFGTDCYLACAVMLGVAEESWTLETAGKYAKWAGVAAQSLADKLAQPKLFYLKKIEEFFKSLRGRLDAIPAHLKDTFELDVAAILQLIRLTRNEAGHALTAKLDEDACFSHLVVYARAHLHLHQLQDHFASTPPPPVGGVSPLSATPTS